MFLLLKTDYFQMWFLYGIDWRVSIALETMDKLLELNTTSIFHVVFIRLGWDGGTNTPFNGWIV